MYQNYLEKRASKADPFHKQCIRSIGYERGIYYVGESGVCYESEL
jgi:hypothetical protein